MFLRFGWRYGIATLLVAVGMMLMSGSTWAPHDCCGHFSGASQAADPGPEASPDTDSDCVYACCQVITAISHLPGIVFQFDPRWSIVFAKELATSHAGSDIFHPPLA